MSILIAVSLFAVIEIVTIILLRPLLNANKKSDN
jgi:hypothetical protein